MHPSSEDLECYYLDRLSPSQVPEMESHILTCGLCLDRLLSFAQPSDGPRFSAGADVSICVLDRANSPFRGKMLEFSEKELKIRLAESLHPGTWAQAHVESRIIMGMVRYCLPHDREFHVSLEVKSIFQIPAKVKK